MKHRDDSYLIGNKFAKKPTLASIFQNCSQSTVAANPQLLASYIDPGKQNDSTAIVGGIKGKRGVMNKTESEFALMLEAQKRAGEILRYEFEGITLRWAGVRYTPDFLVFDSLPDEPETKPLRQAQPTQEQLKQIHEGARRARERVSRMSRAEKQELERRALAIIHSNRKPSPSHEQRTRIRLIEVKGNFIKGKFERAIERFRHAKTYWPEFSFEMHQKTKQGWKRKF